MLPHKKYFSSVPCPDNEDGECRRPYCHFFHKFKSCSDKGSHSKRTTATVASAALSWSPGSSLVKFPVSVGRGPPSEASYTDSTRITTHDSATDPFVGTLGSVPIPNAAPSVTKTDEVNNELDDTTEDELHIDEDAVSQTTSDDDHQLLPKTQETSNIIQDSAVQQDKTSLGRSFDSSSSGHDDGKDDFGNESSSTSEHFSKDEAEGMSVSVPGDSGLDQTRSDPSSISQSAAQSSLDASALSANLLQSDMFEKLVSEAVKKYIAQSPLLANVDPSSIVGKINASAIAESIVGNEIIKASNQQVTSNASGSDSKKRRLYPRPPGIPDYKPTPISELNRRKSAEKCINSSDTHNSKIKTPSNTDYSPTLGQDAETTDFSSIEEDEEDEQQKLHSEFDMLDEVIAENSKANSKKYRIKEYKKRKQALARLKISSIREAELPTQTDEKDDDKDEKNSDTQTSKFDVLKDAFESSTDTCIGEPSLDVIFPKPHILVPVVSQVTRKPWTPGGAVRPLKSSAPDMLEAVLQVLDGPPNPPSAPVIQPLPVVTGYKEADLTKEIQSLTYIGSDNTNTQKSSEGVDNSLTLNKEEKEDSTVEQSLKTHNGNGCKNGLVLEKLEDGAKTEAIKKIEGEEEEEDHSQKKNSDASESDSEQSKVSRKRSRSRGRSSSREHRRRKRRRREKKLKHKHSKSKKRRRKRSYSSEYDTDMASDDHPKDDDVDDANVAGIDDKVKQEKSGDESDRKQEGGASDDSSKAKKMTHQGNSDSEYMSSKSDKTRSRKRKKTKHRRKNKRKYKKRRYRSSSSTDGSYSSSSDDDYRSRKRRRKGVDLSIVKQEDDEVIDLTVIKDESESSDGIEPLVVASVKKEKLLREEGIQSPMPKTVLEPKTEDVSTNDVKTESTSSKPKEEATPKVVLDLKGQCRSPFTAEEAKSNKSTSDQLPAADKEKTSKSRTSSGDSSQSSGATHDTDTEQPPPTPKGKAFAAVLEKPAATVYSSKTKTLTEISIFDSLLDGSKASSIKTIKKKRVEELSSSSLTPTLSDDEELVKKVTTTSSSHRSSTSSLRRSSSSHRSSSSSQTSSSKHISKSSSSSNKSSSCNSHQKDSSKAKSGDGGGCSNKSSGLHGSSGDKLKSGHDSKKGSVSSTSDKDRKDKTGNSKSRSDSSKQRSSSQSSNVGRDKETKNVSSSQHSSHNKSHRSEKEKSTKEKHSSKSSPRTVKDPGSHSAQGKADMSAKNASSQDSEGVSDREPFSFNAGYSQGSSDDNDGDGSPLPDLSALDAIPDEDWNMLAASHLPEDDDGDHLEGTVAAEDECLKLYNDFQQPLPPAPTQKKRASDATSSAAATAEDPASSRIQRIARPGAAGNLLRRQDRPLPPYIRKTPDQVMRERYAKLRSEGEELRQKLAERKAQLQSSSRPLLASITDRRPGAPSAAPPGTAAFALGASGSRKPRIGVPSNVNALITASKALKRQQSASTRSPSSVSAYCKESIINRASTSAPPAPTLATAGAKGIKRIAHIPKLEVLARPIIASEFGAKVPQNVRQRYLNSFIDEAIKFADNQADAFNIAIAEEKVCYRRASSRAVYLSLAVNTTKRLRGSTISDQAKELMESMPESVSESSSGSSAGSSSAPPAAHSPAATTAPRPRVQSHFSTLAGGGRKGSWSIEKPVKMDIQSKLESLKGVKLYKFVQRYVMTKEQLEENGYPQAHPDIKGKAIVCKVDTRKRISPSPTERYCARCGVLFLVDKWGFPKTIANCVHHWGRVYKRRGACGFESRYSCCSGDHESGGCCLASTHVSDNYDPNNLTGFVRTLTKEPDFTGDFGVYALDCEMCYTTAGNELTRITVVGHDNAIVYETFVQPDNHILDYNTRFSGISEEDLEDCKTTIRDVQAALLTRFSSRTVLIGHSLESDLLALKLIHHTVIDTSLMFPHKMGAPFKRALRNLASDHLKKLIQNDVGGHDSAEDAITCMELLHWKIKEDLKTTAL